MRRDVFTADVFVYQALTPPRCNVRLPCHASLRIRLVCLCNPESLASCVCNVTSSNSCLIQKKGDFAHLRERSGTFFRTPGGSLWKLEAITLHVCKWARIWVFIGAGHLRENSLSYSDLSSLLRNLWRGNRGLVSMAKQADRFHLEVCDLWGLWSPWTYMYMGNESPPPKKKPLRWQLCWHFLASMLWANSGMKRTDAWNEGKQHLEDLGQEDVPDDVR